MQIVVLLPALVAGLVSLLVSPSFALVYVYLPTLLLLPDGFAWNIPGTPGITFHEMGLLPILAAAPFSHRATWRPKVTDLLVLAFVVVLGASQYHNTDAAATRNLLFDVICSMAGPYFIASLLIEQEGRRVEFAKVFITMLILVSLLSVWQFRMGTNLFSVILEVFFPGQDLGPSGYRLGFARISGPLGGPILAGMVLAVALFLMAWLHRCGHVQRRVSWLAIITLTVGFAMTQSRGPVMGFTLAACPAMLGFVRAKERMLFRILFVFVVAGAVMASSVSSYVQGGRDAAQTIDQRNAAYRLDLIDAYIPTIMERPQMGWGAGEWPVTDRLYSVDNHYMLLALDHGLYSVGLLLAIILWVSGRLFFVGLRSAYEDPTGILAFILLGAVVSIGLTIATVYLGAQTRHVLFMMLGWSEAVIQGSKVEIVREPAFRRVLGRGNRRTATQLRPTTRPAGSRTTWLR
ncbi:MAG: O-antigen ligase family protein [Planctomycetes bacterium]|nr:O-antigen ligase family protein [Planctomycetota bacterium]